jgi:RHS repeat-associated protein
VGSPNLVTDAQGSLVGIAKNLPFGERFGGLGIQSAQRFATHEDQPGSPIFMQSRAYLPSYGRFGQVDPAHAQFLEDPGTWNLYSYVENRPTFLSDPFGLAPAAPGSRKKRGRQWEWVDGDRVWGHWEWVDDDHSQATFVPDADGMGPDDDPDDEEVVHGLRSTDPLAQTNYVQVVNDTSFPMPHTFILFYRADGSSYGLGHYPKPSYKYLAPFWSVPGEIRQNTGHDYNNVAITLRLSNNQLQALTLSIFAHSGDNYNLENGSLYNKTSNCTGWVNIVLSDAGLLSPGSVGGFLQNPWSN